ncbi:MAG TPA: hypothetical protein VMF30_09125 [Pirellulales bacterium]|nr:hypothetical protein [Pirellulales bacterium]
MKAVEREHGAARFAIARLRDEVKADPSVLRGDDENRKALAIAHENLEGTYLVRLFAAFEAALRSFDRARYNDPTWDRVAAILIDATASHRRIGEQVRDSTHAVRRQRNWVAHEKEWDDAARVALAQARSNLCRFLSHLPDEWE